MTAVHQRIPIEVVAAVIVCGRKILLGQRSGGELDGLWEFPGGKFEPGESWAEAAERELQEELGLEVIPCQPLVILEHDYPSKRVRLFFVRCILPSGTNLAENDVARWFDIEEALALPLCPADQMAFRRLPWEEIFDLQNIRKRVV